MNSIFDIFNYYDSLPYYSKKEKESYNLVIPVPGFKKDEITIEVKNNRLVIEGKAEDGTFYKRSFSKSFLIPESVSIDDIEAKLEDGILKLSLPESKKSSKKLVSIN